MLIVKPIGGLANRMRVISASIQLAKQTSSDLQFIWDANAELGAMFDDLFQESANIIIRKPIERKLLSSYKQSKIKAIIARLWNRLSGIDYYFSDVNVDSIIEKNNDFRSFFSFITPLLQSGKTVHFVTGDYLAELTDVSMFQPILPIQVQISDFLSNFSEQTYGLHIRRTDHKWAIENSPLDAFCQIIEDVIVRDANTKFYLSTDDEATAQTLRQKYGNIVMIRPKTYGRDSLKAMQDAVVDMWLLSKTKCIYGSFYSSFSTMAGHVGNIQVIAVHK